MAIRVIIVDDHAIVRKGLAGFLKAFDDLEFVGEAGSGDHALILCQDLQPDVVLMDMVMPGMSGVEATHAIRASYPAVQVVILTSFADEEMVQAGLQAGAIGYLLKNASIHEMAAAIRAAYDHKPTLSPEAMQALIRSRTRPAEPQFDFKERELEILALMIAGMTNPQMAETMSLSISTIKFYVSSILSKMGVETRTEAVAFALQHNLIPKE